MDSFNSLRTTTTIASNYFSQFSLILNSSSTGWWLSRIVFAIYLLKRLQRIVRHLLSQTFDKFLLGWIDNTAECSHILLWSFCANLNKQMQGIFNKACYFYILTNDSVTYTNKTRHKVMLNLLTWRKGVRHCGHVTRLGDLLHFGQIFKAFGNN